ncbi:hypothetical protein ACQKIW_31480 [Bacillus thuringiensis]|uniref:hypothetical protein n=1 Tax=Bacillus thuringiensis TaxID=1428 RepID=UPI003D07A3E1
MNISLGKEFDGIYSQNEQSTLEMVWNHLIIPVAVRGNEGNERMTYPNVYNYVLSVRATDKLNPISVIFKLGHDVGITISGGVQEL